MRDREIFDEPEEYLKVQQRWRQGTMQPLLITYMPKCIADGNLFEL